MGQKSISRSGTEMQIAIPKNQFTYIIFDTPPNPEQAASLVAVQQAFADELALEIVSLSQPLHSSREENSGRGPRGVPALLYAKLFRRPRLDTSMQ